jgi:hypothetical protein
VYVHTTSKLDLETIKRDIFSWSPIFLTKPLRLLRTEQFVGDSFTNPLTEGERGRSLAQECLPAGLINFPDLLRSFGWPNILHLLEDDLLLYDQGRSLNRAWILIYHMGHIHTVPAVGRIHNEQDGSFEPRAGVAKITKSTFHIFSHQTPLCGSSRVSRGKNAVFPSLTCFDG